MRLIDLSQPVFDECPNCPVHPPVSSKKVSTHESGGWQLELLTLANHTGSHLDAPLHKLAGHPAIDELPLETFVGPAVIVDLRGIVGPSTGIGPELLEPRLGHLQPDQIVLIATGWGDRREKSEEWLRQPPYISTEGARWLVERKARAVGMDHYSVGSGADPQDSETHMVLLGAGIWILEELKFPEEVFSLPQPQTLWALPINLQGHSGAWCRPVIMMNDEL
ncbi:MAG: cyclase family protein [Armatimonadetes bacterium]|nr:cyclase family protein [Armatimonadota bacterium]